ncbi:MAG: ParA family protein, partial [Nanopusillaceae archaeon]
MIVSFISMKGGVGKTTLAINLAAYIKKLYDYKVLLIDTNGIYSPNLMYIKDKLISNTRLWQDIKILPFFHLKITNGLYEGFENDLSILSKYYNYIIFD